MAAATSIIPPVTPSITAAQTTPASSSSTSSSGSTDNGTIAGNFQTFLTLLTTQLKNQNPLDPLDTNQFTQQLVQFAQVEQQIKQNQQLETLISIEKSAQVTTALAYVGQTATVDGQTAALANNKATWSFTSPKPATATISIRSASGQTVHSATFSVSAGTQNFVWDGRDSNGTKWPDGNYTISIVGKDASGQPVSIATEVEGVVDSVDVTKSPPILSIGGQDFTLDKIKRVTRPGA
jgi:flagellar basal-body rod modification protein FlgD